MAKGKRSQAEAQMQGGVGNQTPNSTKESAEKAQVFYKKWNIGGAQAGDE